MMYKHTQKGPQYKHIKIEFFVELRFKNIKKITVQGHLNRTVCRTQLQINCLRGFLFQTSKNASTSSSVSSSGYNRAIFIRCENLCKNGQSFPTHSCDKTVIHEENIYQEVQQYLLSRDWAGIKWHPVLKVWEQLQDKHSEEMQNSYR